MPSIAKCQGNFEGLSVLCGSKKFPYFGAYLAFLVSCEILHREAYWLGNPTLKSLSKPAVTLCHDSLPFVYKTLSKGPSQS